jgi:hypothetical protein
MYDIREYTAQSQLGRNFGATLVGLQSVSRHVTTPYIFISEAAETLPDAAWR